MFRLINLLICAFLTHTAWPSLLEQANTAYASADFPKAVQLYKKAIMTGENPALCYFNLGNACFQMDSISRAIVYYQSCVAYAPDFFRGHLNLGIAYYSLEDAGRSIASLKRALGIEPENEKAMMVLAASYRKAGGLSDAAGLFERIAEKNPDNGDAMIALGEIYRQLEDPNTALKWLLRYPSGGKNIDYVQLLIADIYENEKEYQKAIYYVSKTFDLDKSKQWLLYRLVSLYIQTGNLHVALESAQNGLHMFPDFSELALLAGNCAFELSKYPQAERYYEIARKNGSAGAVIGLENIRVIREQSAEAE